MGKLNPLIKRLLQRPEKDRLKIATELFQSVEHRTDPQMDLAWRKEIRRRIAEEKKGKRKFVSWAEAREQLRKRFHAAA